MQSQSSGLQTVTARKPSSNHRRQVDDEQKSTDRRRGTPRHRKTSQGRHRNGMKAHVAGSQHLLSAGRCWICEMLRDRLGERTFSLLCNAFQELGIKFRSTVVDNRRLLLLDTLAEQEAEEVVSAAFDYSQGGSEYPFYQAVERLKRAHARCDCHADRQPAHKRNGGSRNGSRRR